ncbi:SH2 domain-containing protein 4A [Synchiropus splendidus]|uniref:SH2 domain-containing protein 4A n=1 Tax=Synchiropus splendidus TaxID=270530 RepID=UPI00237E81A3|nr:SH2 domain-containing protein 4A [Synchiropus splendidus]XP_053703363.1 SH2 domain-containing protein 4A [Synchiropus splendidus]
MLQQILKDMYIDPDVLDALNEDQKKTLFQKMRQEQVRRWKEREEKLEKEGGDAELKRAKPKKANSKNVSWLPGRDGDVAVVVIGEVDELSSKFICAGLGEKKGPSLQNSTNHRTILKSKEGAKTERQILPPKTQAGVSLSLKGKSEETSALVPLLVSASERPSSATEKPELQAVEEKSVPQTSICSRPPMRTGHVNVRPASANVAPGSVNTRPGVANLRLASAAAAPPSSSSDVKTDSGPATSAAKGDSQAAETQTRNQMLEKDVTPTLQKANSEDAGTAPTPAGRGRVAQLMKTFSTDSTTPPAKTPARGIKPPLPSKPGHLRVTTSPTVR